MAKYTHLELNKEVNFISGYYIPLKEVRLKFNGREVLYVVGQAVVQSSCCAGGSRGYVLVPGYIIHWQNEENINGLPTSEVEPVSDKPSQDNIREIIKEGEHITDIQFW